MGTREFPWFPTTSLRLKYLGAVNGKYFLKSNSTTTSGRGTLAKNALAFRSGEPHLHGVLKATRGMRMVKGNNVCDWGGAVGWEGFIATNQPLAEIKHGSRERKIKHPFGVK